MPTRIPPEVLEIILLDRGEIETYLRERLADLMPEVQGEQLAWSEARIRDYVQLFAEFGQHGLTDKVRARMRELSQEVVSSGMGLGVFVQIVADVSAHRNERLSELQMCEPEDLVKAFLNISEYERALYAEFSKAQAEYWQKRERVAAELYADFFEHSPYPALAGTPDLTIQETNPACLRLLGLTRGDVVRKGLFEWLTEMSLSPARLIEIKQRLEDRGSFFQEEVRLRCPNGCDEKYLLLSVNFLIDAERNRTGFQAFLEDMTQRHALEERLSAERNQMNAVFDSSPTGFIFVDSHRHIQRINTEACRLLGYPPPEQIVNTDMNSFRQEAQRNYKDPEKFMRVVSQLYEDPKNSAVGIWELVLPTRWVRYYVSPVHDSHGEPIGWLWILNDMTDRIAREQLRNDLTHMIVHDLKNPLTAIQGGVYVIKNLLGSNESNAARALDVIGRNATRMQRMVMNLLDIERLEQGKLELAIRDIRLKEMMETIIEGQRPAAGDRDLVLDYDPFLPTVPIKADDNLLERVITNLLSNAIKHTRPNGRIVLRALGDARGYLSIQITDDGDGIDKKYHKKIFERFGQAELRRDGHGVDTGLGLTFCKLAVEAHQGQITVDSEPGKGSTFTIRLPGLMAQHAPAESTISGL